MEQFVVTVSRQFASKGRPVAQKLSQLLDVEFWDRDIVEATAKRMQETVSVIGEAEESARKSFDFARKYHLNLASYNMNDEIFAVQKNIIQDVAEKKSCIIVGRCGDSILRDYPNVLNVFIYAPYEARLKHCMEILEQNEKKAVKMIHDVDLARAYYQKRYCPEDKDVFDQKHLMLDTSYFGVDQCAEIIAEVVRKRFF